MTKIEAYLCFPCKFLLSDYLDVQPLYEIAHDPQECPWCQKEKAVMKYLLCDKKSG